MRALGNRSSGVTLIELLVVMTIMTTILAIVGSTTIESFGRAKAQTEIITVYSLIKKTSVKAFATGTFIDLKFENDAVSVIMGQKIQSKIMFEHLYFESQRLRINRNGHGALMLLTVRVRDIKRNLDLRPLFDNGIARDT